MNYLINKILLIIFICGLTLLIACSGSGSNSLSPQVTIPLPSNDDDGITISAPNSEGMVAITGSKNLVDENIVIIAQVLDATEAASSSESEVQNLGYARFALVEAQTTCGEEIPICPDISSNGICQYEPNSDGSFSFTVEADVTDYINLSYQNTETCESGEIAEVQITEEETVLDREDISLPTLTTDEDGTSSSTVSSRSNSDGTSEYYDHNTATGAVEYTSSDSGVTGVSTSADYETDSVLLSLYEVIDSDYHKLPLVEIDGDDYWLVVGVYDPDYGKTDYYIVYASNYSSRIKVWDYWFMFESEHEVIANYYDGYDSASGIEKIISLYSHEDGLYYEFYIDDREIVKYSN